MGRSARTAGRALEVTALCLAGVLPATAASAATSCHTINATGAGQPPASSPGPTGDLTLSGTQDPTGAFTETVTGNVCADLSP
jgi:hypothetical protein